MNRIPSNIIFGFIVALLLAAPSSFADGTGGDALQVSQSRLDALDERSASLTVDQSKTNTNVTIDDSEHRHANESAQPASTDNVIDTLMSSSGSVLTAIMVAGLLVLAAVNSRKRPLRMTRNPRHGD